MILSIFIDAIIDMQEEKKRRNWNGRQAYDYSMRDLGILEWWTFEKRGCYTEPGLRQHNFLKNRSHVLNFNVI